MKPSILLLSTADWTAPLWTNKQFMACELAHELEVTYVESLGLRRPAMTRRDLKRMASRLFRAGTPKLTLDLPRQRPQNLRIISPRVIPLHFGLSRRFNQKRINRLSRNWLSHPDNSRVLWTYSPITYGLESFAPVIYHCVDLLGSYPGIDDELIRKGEENLARAGALAIASGSEVSSHLKEIGFKRVIEWLNVAEVDPYLSAVSDTRHSNLVVFGGNISPYKIDCSLIEALMDRIPGVEVVLAGPIAEGGGRPWSELDRLKSRGVRFVGTLSVPALAKLFNQATVGIIPYVINDYTRGVNPLKVYEYLAAGLPVVSSQLPSLPIDDQDIVVTSTPATFAATVESFLGSMNARDVARRRERSREHSWTRRGDQARQLVSELLTASSPHA